MFVKSVFSRFGILLNKSPQKAFLSNQNNKFINVAINGENFEFPAVWLRDNCQCENCYHKPSQSRTIKWNEFDVNITPEKVDQQNSCLKVIWSDGHTSAYTFDWLKKRSFKQEYEKEYTNAMYRPKQKIWSSHQFSEIFKEFKFNSVLTSDEHCHDWLESLSVYGVTLLKEVPQNEDCILQLIDEIGFLKQTHYGKTFIVENKPGANNVAYLSSDLQPHTDLPYYEYCPGTTFLHCITQTNDKGGYNTLVDIHYVAETMKVNNPEEFEILCKVDVEWCDIGSENGNEFYKLFRAPVICMKNDQIVRINSSIPQRGSHFPTDINYVLPWYKAYKHFITLLNENVSHFKTNPGEILVFDNIRLMHGRTAYNDSTNNVRKLIGGYVDWDEIYSRLRCLKVKLKKF